MNDGLPWGQTRSAELRWLGAPPAEVRYLAATTSTNDDVRRLATADAPRGTVVVADTQTGGRGRGDHQWHSPKGCNLYLSVLVREEVSATRAPLLALAMGLAVARCCDHFVAAERVKIKWPNDVQIDQRKVAGVLVEGALQGHQLSYAIAGVGFNVLRQDWPAEIADRAIALGEVAALGTDARAKALGFLLAEIESVVDQWASPLGSVRWLDEVRSRCATLGREVTVGDHRGLAVDIEDDGALRLLRSTGEITRVYSGEVTTESARPRSDGAS
ncbi:MAG: biotin--[acetyl-CoA-carboxylase] ligase [Deltaproteobacteria bacterium]|nr:biotin--[acetyl-CoA-carboxylase] ligase [Deltaproteobacteria bacterium]